MFIAKFSFSLSDTLQVIILEKEMPLSLNHEVFITCAVTGSGSTQDRSNLVPRSPKDIADSAINAARAGAAIVHCHVRDPETGKPSRNLAYYREVTAGHLKCERPAVGAEVDSATAAFCTRPTSAG